MQQFSKILAVGVLSVSSFACYNPLTPAADIHFADAGMELCWQDKLDTLCDLNIFEPENLECLLTGDIPPAVGYWTAGSIKTLDCSAGYGIRSTDGISRVVNLEGLDLSYNGIVDLDLGSLPKLTKLDVVGNRDDNNEGTLSYVNLTLLPNLKDLNLKNNKLDGLNLGQNRQLITVDVGINNLSSLDVSNNAKLVTLDANINKIEAFDVSANSALDLLVLTGNPLGDAVNGADALMAFDQAGSNPDLCMFIDGYVGTGC